jgi:transcriptional repressor NrdR
MVRRRRETLDGRYRFTTYERIEQQVIMVIKKSGRKEPFDRDKLWSAVSKSVGKIVGDRLEEIVNRVETAVQNAETGEVSANFIGETILQVLLDVNEVAYVRFASVFYNFKSIREFSDILNKLDGGLCRL